MNSPREEWSLDTRRLGRRVLVFNHLDSTNNLAGSLADDPANAGLAILADEQTAGRGQHGRVWLSAPRQSVLLSLLVPVPPQLCRPVVITAWAAVAVCATIRRYTGWPARIKWPNDVLLFGRKVCGILIESGNPKPEIRSSIKRSVDCRIFVVGIGLNVHQTASHFASVGLTEAASLAQSSSEPLDTYSIAVDLIRQLDRDFEALRQGDLYSLETRWKEGLGLLGKRVLAECPDGTHRGRLVLLSFDTVELARLGEPSLILVPERVQHLHEADD